MSWSFELKEVMARSPEMSSSTLLEVLRLLDEAAIRVWLDGGWGVDALLGIQTRPHKDVDIIVSIGDVPKLQVALGVRGFAIVRGTPPHALVLVDHSGLEIDVHGVSFDAKGNGIYRMDNGVDWIFPAEGFSGQGVVAGKRVRCLSPKTQVLCHASGYKPTEKDLRDMELIWRRFRIELPRQLRRGEA